jgi:hypothetical protein
MSDKPGTNPPTRAAEEAKAAATLKPLPIAEALEFEFLEATRIPSINLKLRNHLSCS